MKEGNLNYDNQHDQDWHLSVARQLAQEVGVPEATAIQVYERELRRLSASAHVTQYLDILTAKSAKAALMSGRTQSR